MTKNAARLNAKEEDERREALAVIAGDLGLDASALRIESLIESRPAVFYDMPDGTTRSAQSRFRVLAGSACQGCGSTRNPPGKGALTGGPFYRAFFSCQRKF